MRGFGRRHRGRRPSEKRPAIERNSIAARGFFAEATFMASLMTTTLRILLLAGVFLFVCGSTFAKNRKSPGLVVKWKDVPAAVQATMEANTAGGKVKEVQKETVNNSIFYCAEVKGTDGKWSKVYVKETGDLIRIEPDNARNKRKHKPLFGD